MDLSDLPEPAKTYNLVAEKDLGWVVPKGSFIWMPQHNSWLPWCAALEIKNSLLPEGKHYAVPNY